MFYHSSTVPIGGAPFVPPSLALQDAVFYGGSSSSASSSRSSSISSPPSSSPSESHPGSSQACGMATSPSSSSSMQSDYSSSPSRSLSPRQAAAREYARRLHDHTATMWETERHNIERTKLESPGTPPRQKTRPASGGYIRPPAPSALAAAAPVAEPSKERSRAMDVLLGRSWGKKWSGHSRGKSL